VTDAGVLGASYVIYPWILHQNEFTEADCRRAVWGKSLKQAGMEFCYHPHGYEFRPSPGGTLFDLQGQRARNVFGKFSAQAVDFEAEWTRRFSRGAYQP
jgi:hypothetical protein